ncbi:MAG: trimeric intracellular cation channel family protein [Granulosicoccus sp.]
MLLTLDLLATICFASSGASIALDKRLNGFGVFLSAVLTATGGGTVREALLHSDTLFWVENPGYPLAILGAIVLAVSQRKLPRLSKMFCLMLHSLSVTVFITVGVLAALESDCNPVFVLSLGVLTGIGGGIIRQMLFERCALVDNKMNIFTAFIIASLCMVLVQSGVRPVGTIIFLALVYFVLIKCAGISKKNKRFVEVAHAS